MGVNDSEADTREYFPNTRCVLRVSLVSLTGKAVTHGVLKGRPAIVFHAWVPALVSGVGWQALGGRPHNTDARGPCI